MAGATHRGTDRTPVIRATFMWLFPLSRVAHVLAQSFSDFPEDPTFKLKWEAEAVKKDPRHKGGVFLRLDVERLAVFAVR